MIIFIYINLSLTKLLIQLLSSCLHGGYYVLGLNFQSCFSVSHRDYCFKSNNNYLYLALSVMLHYKYRLPLASGYGNIIKILKIINDVGRLPVPLLYYKCEL